MELAISMLSRDEGRRLKPYKDTTGHLTIGVGRNLDGVGLSDSEVDFLLNSDIQRAWKDAQRVFTSSEWNAFTDMQRLGITNMVFNLGYYGFKKFKMTIHYLKLGRFQEAKMSALSSKWATQVKSRSDRVTDLFLNKNTYES